MPYITYKKFIIVVAYILLIIIISKLYFDKLRSDRLINEVIHIRRQEFSGLSSTKNVENDDLNKANKLLNYLNIFKNNQDNVEKENPKSLIFTTITTTTSTTYKNEVPKVKLYDLNKNVSSEEYDTIQCRKSLPIHNVATTLCVHDLNRDVHVSGSIWRDGIWEPPIIRQFMGYLVQYPDWLVLDIGAQIGQYSLFAAKLGRKVLTIEPFYENILRIHKASVLEGINSRITLITNAISNKRNEIKMLQPASDNIGGQSLIEKRLLAFTENDLKNSPDAKYLVETILFDDIVPYLPLGDNLTKYDKAIMKIDIECFEPFAFQYAKELFNTIDVKIIFMEWGNLAKHFELSQEIEEMLNFLYTRNYTPRTGENIVLDRQSWRYWAWDIVWHKPNY